MSSGLGAEHRESSGDEVGHTTTPVVVPIHPLRMTMTVKKETAQIRPFVVCAILRNVTFDQDRYAPSAEEERQR